MYAGVVARALLGLATGAAGAAGRRVRFRTAPCGRYGAGVSAGGVGSGSGSGIVVGSGGGGYARAASG
ncbi:hypothetical protein HEK616_05200 [Streptomyces nigrescens]|uniref:Uncharacterized protein n=1 Tax=Streptomyces nigrescens TaxID=1920 RepID=A0ABN6QLF7_STRNI|nr:hypothetical protein HEK616_05200 [Streptomyces nigrescens]